MSFANKNTIQKAMLATSLIAMMATASLAFAAPNATPGFDPKTAIVGTGEGAVQTLGAKIANIFGTIIMAISVIMILYAALMFLTAGGDGEKITSARSTLIYALIGVAVALLAYVLPNIISGFIQNIN